MQIHGPKLILIDGYNAPFSYLQRWNAPYFNIRRTEWLYKAEG